MAEKRYEKRMNFNIDLPSKRCFKTDEVIVDKKEDEYEALSINDIVYRLNQIDELDQENQKLDEKVCLLTMDLIKTKSYDQLEKELNKIKNENEQLKQFQEKVFKLIDNNIKIYEDTTTNDEFLQIQLDTKLQTLYNLRKELLKK